MLNIEIGRDEDVVDAGIAAAVLHKVVPRTGGCHALSGMGIAVAQDARTGEYPVNLVRLVNVEVARQNRRLRLGELPDTLQDEPCTLPPCHSAHVVHVGIEEIELLSRRLVLELPPRQIRMQAASHPSEGRSGVCESQKLPLSSSFSRSFR